MKKSVFGILKVSALFGGLFFLASCGSDETCVTCTLEGSDDVEICDPGTTGSQIVFDAAVTAQEAAGYSCN